MESLERMITGLLAGLVLVLTCILLISKLENEQTQKKVVLAYYESALKAKETEDMRYENEKIRKYVFEKLRGE